MSNDLALPQPSIKITRRKLLCVSSTDQTRPLAPAFRHRRCRQARNGRQACSPKTASRKASTKPSPASRIGSAKQPYNNQQQYRADRGDDDRRNNARTHMNAQMRHQPAANQSAHDADGDVADDTKPAARDNFPRKPAGYEPDQQNDEKTLRRDVHAPPHCLAIVLLRTIPKEPIGSRAPLWVKSDMCVAKIDVRFTPNSDRESGFPAKDYVCFTPKADMCSARSHVR